MVFSSFDMPDSGLSTPYQRSIPPEPGDYWTTGDKQRLKQLRNLHSNLSWRDFHALGFFPHRTPAALRRAYTRMQKFITKQLLIPDNRRSNGHIALKTKRPLPPEPRTSRHRPVKHVRVAEDDEEESTDEDGDTGNDGQTEPLRVSFQLSRDKRTSQSPNHGRRSITSFLKDGKDVKTPCQQKTTPPTGGQLVGLALKERPDVIDLVNTCSPSRPASDRGAQPRLCIPTAPCYQSPFPQSPPQISKTPTRNGVVPATPALRVGMPARHDACQTPIETPSKHDLSPLITPLSTDHVGSSHAADNSCIDNSDLTHQRYHNQIRTTKKDGADLYNGGKRCHLPST
ncbi:hypothetical protein BDW69DRAFT_94242 [Aspergillus filifer]